MLDRHIYAIILFDAILYSSKSNPIESSQIISFHISAPPRDLTLRSYSQRYSPSSLSHQILHSIKLPDYLSFSPKISVYIYPVCTSTTDSIKKTHYYSFISSFPHIYYKITQPISISLFFFFIHPDLSFFTVSLELFHHSNYSTHFRLLSSSKIPPFSIRSVSIRFTLLLSQCK